MRKRNLNNQELMVDRKDNKLEVFGNGFNSIITIDEDEINFNEIVYYCDGDNDILDKEKYDFIEFFWDIFVDREYSFKKVYNINGHTFYKLLKEKEIKEYTYATWEENMYDKYWKYYCDNFDKEFKKDHIERYKEFFIEKHKDLFVEFVVKKRICDYLKLDIYDYFSESEYSRQYRFYERLNLNKPESRLDKMKLVKD